MCRDSRALGQTTYGCLSAEWLAWRSRASSRRGHVDATGYDLSTQCFDARAHAVRNQRAVLRIVHIPHAVFGKAKLIDTALETMLLYQLDDVEHRFVNTLHHRREYMSWRLRVLISVDTDREMAGLPRCFEYAESRRA